MCCLKRIWYYCKYNKIYYICGKSNSIYNKITLMNDSIKVGKYILSLCKEAGIYMNQTKLQKLMYVVYGAYLANDDERLCDEHPKAWPFGPVFPKVQKYFAKSENFTEVSPSLSKTEEFKSLTENEKLNNVITSVIKVFGHYSAKDLSEWSHKNGSPWVIALNSNNGQWNSEISDEVIKSYFLNHVIKKKDA